MAPTKKPPHGSEVAPILNNTLKVTLLYVVNLLILTVPSLLRTCMLNAFEFLKCRLN